MKTKNVHEVQHPLVQDIITTLRDINTDSELFRINLDKLTKLLLYEVLSDLEMKARVVPTQTGVNYNGAAIKENVAFISILRAGLGMLSSAMDYYPKGEFHVIGMKRCEDDPYNTAPNFYLDRLEEMNGKVNRVIVMDPMLATGGSMVCALKAIREKHNFKGRIQVVSIIAAQKGVSEIARLFPDIIVTCAGFDKHLNEHAYIIPGLGDAGDRLFGIKTDLATIRDEE